MNIMMMIAMMMRMMMLMMIRSATHVLTIAQRYSSARWHCAAVFVRSDSSGLDPLGARGFEILAPALKKNKKERRVAADLTRSQIKSDTLQRT